MNNEQTQAIEEMVSRRMAHTGETRKEACLHIKQYLCQNLEAYRANKGEGA